MIIIIAYFDYITPPEISARLFYLVPLFLTVWDGKGIKAGLYFSLICTLVYFYTESIQGNIHWHGFSLFWEYSIICSYFIVFVVAVYKIKKYTLLLSIKNEELEKANNQKDKFFSIIAHDLRSPFQGFLGITQNLAENADSYSAEELPTVFMQMHQTADNLFNLLRNLLEWAQMQKGAMNFQPKELFLFDLVAENAQTLEKRGEQKGITIINKVSSEVKVCADERMINSVLLNLISNAVKFTNRNGKVTISANNTEEQMIEVYVSDTGIGMPKSSVEKLFNVGEKIRSVGTDGELSTGLGLILCKEFVEKHGGKIWAESEQGMGSSFYFSIPSINKP
jgi:signal transduction histidine kinase